MALDYDGVDDVTDHGDIAGIDGASALTAMCWANIDTLELFGGLFGKSTGAAAVSFSLRMASDVNTKMAVVINGAPTDDTMRTGAGVVVAGVWDHWTLWYDGSGVTSDDKVDIYKNAVSQALTAVETVPATLPDSGANGVVTGKDNRSATFTDGKIALVKIWTAALTAAEIAQEMNSYRPVRTANLVLWAPYDDGTSARDYSGVANHGTVTGALQSPGPPVSYGGAA